MTDTTDPLWIFLHLPKSGGTTFKAHLEKHFAWDEELIEFSHWGRHYRGSHGRPEFADRPEAERQRARVLAGHNLDFGIHRLVPGREPRYCTFVRDPAERCVSLYNFRRSRGVTEMPFDDWYEEVYNVQYNESVVRFYTAKLVEHELGRDPEAHLAVAKQMIERCWFVTTTDRLNATLGGLCEAMGIPSDWETLRSADESRPLPTATHPSKGERVVRHFTLDDATRARIYADSPCDFEFYCWVQARLR